MGFYSEHILPPLLDVACGMKAVSRQREKVVPLATGDVLEIGIGSGLNLPWYNTERVNRIWGLEPSAAMRERAQKKYDALGMTIPLDFIDLPGEQIPLPDNVADTIVMTYTLCTIPEPDKALANMLRVLKPEGRLLFCEHARAPDLGVQQWQDRLNRPWRRVAGGCNMNRPILDLISDNGFTIQESDEMYVPGPKILTFNVWGSAVIAA
ncbi:MAG: class I SAM-dependent methyltransferase [Pseudomonadota bacterium]